MDKGTITLSTMADADWLEIRIADSGCGIPQAHQNKIFDPFFTTKKVGVGTGQGLAIARNVVVDKHQGSLHFTSELGRGTTFIIRLPLH
jgi:signal transduction histidine kinase